MGKVVNAKKSSNANVPKKKRYQYSPENLDKARNEVLKSKMGLRAAAKKFDVPTTTLHNHLKHKFRSTEKQTVLSAQEEKELCEWIFRSCDNGFPVTKNQLLDGVKLYLDTHNRDTKFVENRPKGDWYNHFLGRHPEVVVRASECLTKGRANLTERAIRNWFQKVRLITFIFNSFFNKQIFFFFLFSG